MRQLRLFRITFCTSLACGLLLSLSRFSGQIFHYRNFIGERKPRFVGSAAPFAPVRSFLLEWHNLFGLLLIVSLLWCALADRLARPVLAWTILLFWIYGGVVVSADTQYFTYRIPSRVFDLIFPALLLLLLDPGRRDDQASMAANRDSIVVNGIKLSLALIYFGSGIAKLRTGAAWLGGGSLQSFLLWTHFRNGSAVAFALAQSQLACAILGNLALVFELTAPFLVCWRPTTKLFLAAAFCFHLFAETVMNVNFLFPFFAPAFLIFLPLEPVDKYLESVRGFFIRKGHLAAAALMLFLGGQAFADTAYRAPHFECLVPDPVLLFRPKPNCEGQAVNPDGTEIHYKQNSLGLWDVEHPAVAAPGSIRVLFVGNSLWIPHREKGSVPDFFRAGLADLPIETINGSVNGFSLVQNFLFLPELLDHYHPRVVLMLGNAMGNGLSTFYHHEIASRRDWRGQAVGIGPVKSFWPLPESFAPSIWKSPSAFQWLIYSTVARELYLLARNYLESGPAAAEVYESYLMSIAEMCRKHGSELVIVREDGLDPGSKLIKYKAETISAKIWPSTIVSTANADALYERISLSGIKVVDLESFAKGLRKLPPADYDIPGDIHLTLAGMQIHGEALAKALHDFLSSLKNPPSDGKR